MAKMTWSEDQLKAIEYKDSNILVSAAAGSGKTTLLVERIVRNVIAGEYDIDRLVVVTFTVSAASDLKAKIAKALLEKEKEYKDDEKIRTRIIKQLSLINSALISTIDSFCGYIVKNYYNTIGIEPNYRIATEGENSLVKRDVYDALLEEYYSDALNDEEKKDFCDFIEAYAAGKDTENFYSIISEIYTAAQSQPWPMEWIKGLCMPADSAEDVKKLQLLKDFMTYFKGVTARIALCYHEYANLYRSELAALSDTGNITNSNRKAADILDSEADYFDKLSNCGDYDEAYKIITTSDFKFETMTLNKDVADNKYIKYHRDMFKEYYQKQLLPVFKTDIAGIVEDSKYTQRYIKVLVRFLTDYTERVTEVKREKNIVDFADIEHYALDILVKRGAGADKTDAGAGGCVAGSACRSYTQVADELSAFFAEIYIDEYQDSNMLQETILQSISKERFGKCNVFMVGDVKQSIYKFRLADPGIFMGKYDTYTDERPNCKILLNGNYRSRKGILDATNSLFEMFMRRDVGGIDYTDDVKLITSRKYDNIEFDDRVMVRCTEAANKAALKEKNNSNAYMVADMIGDLVSQGFKYSDIVILIRSANAKSNQYVNVLTSLKIPVIGSSKKGYFSSWEIQLMLSYLMIIDNPRQEIHLAAVLKSYFFRFTDEELADIKVHSQNRRGELYDNLVFYSQKDEKYSMKVAGFLTALKSYKEYSLTHTISELLTQLIYETGFIDYVKQQVGGKISSGNLSILIARAVEFEGTSYSGLFDFLRYIDTFKSFNSDFGTSNPLSPSDDVVRIESIHSSKGLSYKVVILTETDDKYSNKDSSGMVFVDNKYGLGIVKVDIDKRVKYDTTLYKMFEKMIKLSTIGEELRLLYVAMTRAEDKLCIVGTPSAKLLNNGIVTAEKCINNSPRAFCEFKTNYMYLVLSCVYLDREHGTNLFDYSEYAADKLVDIENNRNMASSNPDVEDRLDILNNAEVSEAYTKLINERLDDVYSHEGIIDLRAKYSVSDLKHKAMEDAGLPEAQLFEEKKNGRPVPLFAQTGVRATDSVLPNGDNAGTLYGSAVHKMFELLDYARLDGLDDEGIIQAVEDMKDESVASGRLGEEYAGLINAKLFVPFIRSDLGRDMMGAALDGRLHREEPFIMEVPASRIDSKYPDDEFVVVQGIIDAFYLEFGEDRTVPTGCIVIDYKTDKVETEEELVDRYKAQLLLYREALMKVTGAPVCECKIYSTRLGKGIDIS